MNDPAVDFDDQCDPNNPRKIKYDDILAAARRITGAVVRTPLAKAHMSEKLGMDIYFKQEFMQFTGSCKERGARNALIAIPEDQKKNGVITASTGNHALALSYHAAQLGIPCVIVMTINAGIHKVTKCQEMGPKVITHGNSFAEAMLHAMTIAKEKKMTYINGYDHPLVVEGQGSIGIEIVEQLPAVDAVLVPVGGGGMLCGIATAIKHLKPDTEIYGVQTDKTCVMVESLRKNERIFLEIDNTICDALAMNMVGVNTFHSIKGLIDKMVVVREDWVSRAIMHIVDEEKVVVEGAGAVTMAAIMAGLFPNLKGKKVVCVVSGGNIDTRILARALERGMSAEGRLVKFKVTVFDRPGGLADLCALMAGIGVTTRDCIPERAWVKGDVFSMELKVLAETRGWEHTKELIEMIKKNYKEYYFQDMSDKAGKTDRARRGPCLAPNPVCMQK